MRRHRSLRSRLVGIPARQLLLLLDYDGTLAPIVLRPDRATLSAPVRVVLRRLVRGKRVLEIRPAGSWNKGTAVAAVLAQPWARNRIPVYLGDDRTDRDAFRRVRGLGLAVRVGGRRGIWDEDAWLAGPAAVVNVLKWLTTRREAVQDP